MNHPTRLVPPAPGALVLYVAPADGKAISVQAQASGADADHPI